MLPSDWLIKNGWTNKCAVAPYPDGGCLINAMAVSGYVDDTRLLNAIENVLGVSNATGIFDWNDHKCPDAATAIAVMRQAEINYGLRPVVDEIIVTPDPIAILQ